VGHAYPFYFDISKAVVTKDEPIACQTRVLAFHSTWGLGCKVLFVDLLYEKCFHYNIQRRLIEYSFNNYFAFSLFQATRSSWNVVITNPELHVRSVLLSRNGC